MKINVSYFFSFSYMIKASQINEKIINKQKECLFDPINVDPFDQMLNPQSSFSRK